MRRSGGRPAAVELSYDGNRRVIGIRGTDPRKRNAFPVKHHTSGRYMRVSGAPFCTQFRLKPEGTVLFDRADLNFDGVLELPLDSLIRVTRGSR
jgi:hypothetical protein